MAQCEAERRKHPTMDLYVGIFNSKFYSSSRGNAHMGASDKRSRNVFNSSSGKVENIIENGASSDRSSFQSRSFRNDPNKPLELFDDYGRFDGNRMLFSNPGSICDESRTSSTDVGHVGYVRKSQALNLYKGSRLTSCESDVHDTNFPQADLNFSSAHSGGNRLKSAGVNVVPELTELSISRANVVHLKDNKNNLSADAVSGSCEARCSLVSSGKNCLHVQDISSKGKESSTGVEHNINEKNRVSYGTELKSNPATNDGLVSEWSRAKTGREAHLETGSCPQATVTGDQECGSRVGHNSVSEHGLCNLKHTKPSKFGEDGAVVHDVVSNTHIQMAGDNLLGNSCARTSQEVTNSTGSSLLGGAGHVKTNKVQGFVSTRRSYSSSSEVHGLVKNDVEGMARSTFQSCEGASEKGLSEKEGMRSEKLGEPNARVSNSTCSIKASADQELEGTCGELSLKDSPSRAHNLVASLRIGPSTSTDSSSSHGGSSHSGSPTAAENVRDNRVSSFGNILLSKGSPRSVSSRSMGSVNISGNFSLSSSKSGFFDSTASQFRYSTSSGRKSAELVPNRRHSENLPNRKSSEIMSGNHINGAVTQGSDGDGMFGKFGRGNGNVSNRANVSLSKGSLLVGSADGNVLSLGGASKASVKQGGVVNQTSKVDNTLLRKAQASSDPEEIKNAGNEYYRRGHFSEALMLYTRAVNLSPSCAAFRSNRAAAFSALGQLGEAVKESEDAIRLDSSYSRAHQRLAALYLRLGLLEKARQHVQSDAMGMQQLRNIDEHISKCIEARKRGEWQKVIRESDAAVVAGADSAPLIFGYKSEALLSLHRPDEADGVCTAAQRVESSLVNSGVLLADPFLLTVRAKIDMALGRFEGAVEAAKCAAKIDPCNGNISMLLRKAQTVYHSRMAGNELFKAGRFFEALALYAEGLESDPMNAVLLCNRAACRSKLGQWEKAVEDCNAALRIEPNYTKALMRRANCWTKLERWEDALQDYELLRRRMPDDLEVARGLFDVQVAMRKLEGEDTRKMKFGGDVEEVQSDAQFREAITSPSLSVVQFVTKWSERCRQLAPFIDILCKRNPCINFLRVDVDDNPYLAKSESVSFIPTFKIYRSGQKVKEILGPTEQSLEYALKHYAL